MTDDLPPHSEQAEAMALACMVESPEIVPSFTEDMFYLVAHKTAFSAIRDCKEGSGTIERLFALSKALPAEAMGVLNSAMDNLPSTAGWPYWRGMLQEFLCAREEIAVRAKLGTGDAQARSAAISKLNALRDAATGADSTSLGSIMPSVVEKLEEAFVSGGKTVGLTTGFSAINRITNGLQPGRVYVIGGRPSTGKSALLLQLAMGVAENVPAAYLSLEMPRDELGKRAIQVISGVSSELVRLGQVTEVDFHRLTTAAVKARKLPLMLVDTVSALHEIECEMSRLVREAGVRAIFLDYIQLVRIRGFKENRTNEVSEISRSMKQIAMQLGVPIVMAAQLSRAVTKERRTPHLADLRESGSIEQDADAVILLHPTDDTPSSRVEVELLFGKNRDGPCCKTKLDFNKPLTRFEEIVL